MQSARGIMVVAGQKPYGFYTVADDISRTLNIPLLELMGKQKYLQYSKLFFSRPSFIISVGTLSPKKLMLLSMASRRVIAYIAVEGPFPIPKYLLWLVNNTNRLLVVTPSNYVKRELSLSGLKVLSVVPHGIDFDKVYRANFKLRFLPKKFRILTVASSLQSRKSLGIRYLFHAWSKLPRSIRGETVVIVKVPEGSRERISQLAASYGVESDEYLVLDSYFTRDELFALYHSSDLYVHVALSDGFGLPIVEALACGTPVMAMDAEPWKEIVAKDVGWLVEVSREVIVYEEGLPYRLKIPSMDDFSRKLAKVIEECKANREILRTRCMEYAQAFNANKVYRRFIEFV